MSQPRANPQPPQPEQRPRANPNPQQEGPTTPPDWRERATRGEYVFPPDGVSPEWVLKLRPNRYEDAVSGPDTPISSTAWVHWTKPDGTDFIAPLSNAETYERKGFKRGATEQIPDIVAWQARRTEERRQRARGEHAERDPNDKAQVEQEARRQREARERGEGQEG